jgi:hypothetical protein
MSKIKVKALLGAAFALTLQGVVCSQNATADNTHTPLQLSQLDAKCNNGGPASAAFMNVHGRQVLDLKAQGITGTDGEALARVNVGGRGIIFQRIEIGYTGVCQSSLGFFEAAISFTPPGSSVSQGISFRCPDMQVPGLPGLLIITPATIAAVTGEGSIPAGSTLDGINLNVQGTTATLQEGFISSVKVNNIKVGFDHTAPAVFCTPD